MEYRNLANGQKIASIGFGTYLIQKQDTIKAVIDAIKTGYRHIDTAQAYLNEEEIGFAIAKCISEGIVKREDLFITSKISPHNKIGYKEAIDAVENSLVKLGLDYIDLYLIHWPNVAPGAMWKKLNAETWRGFEECYNRGLVKNIGVSNFMIHHLEELLKTAKVMPAVNQLHLSPIWQQKEVVNWCNERNIQCVAWSPLVRYNDWAGNFLGNQDYAKCEDWTKEIMDELSGKYKKSKAQISLRWSIQKGLIPIAKSTHKERIEENIDIFDFEISEEDMEKLDSLNARPCNPDATPDSIYNSWSMGIALGKQKIFEKEKLYLFGLPIWKTKRINSQLDRCYLFGFIPILNIKHKNKTKTKYYLFNFLPILKRMRDENTYKYYLFSKIPFFTKVKKIKIIQNNEFLPNYNEQKERKKERKKVNLFDRVYSRMFSYDKIYKNKNYNKFEKLLYRLNFIFNKKVDISSLDVHLTTVCTLKCKNCSHKIPYYKKEHQHLMSVDEFKTELDTILNNINNIHNLLLLGGEPLLHKDLPQIVNYANSKKRIKRIVIVTNGTLIPSESLIKEIKQSSKTIIFISSYDLNKSLKNYTPEKIKDICIENNIPYSFTSGNSWQRQPEIKLEPDKVSEQNVEDNFARCDFKYYTLWSNGKIYPCAYSKYINDKTNEKYSKEFIDLHSKNLSPKLFKNFFKAPFYKVCECCDMTNYGQILFPAIQIEKGK